MYKLHTTAICKNHDDGIMLAKMDDSPEVYLVKSVEKEIVKLMIDQKLSQEALMKKAEELNYEPQKFLIFSEKLFKELEKLQLVEKI